MKKGYLFTRGMETDISSSYRNRAGEPKIILATLPVIKISGAPEKFSLLGRVC